MTSPPAGDPLGTGRTSHVAVPGVVAVGLPSAPREALADVLASLASEPAVLAVVLPAAGVLAVGILAAVRRARVSPGRRLLAVLAEAEEVTVLLHPDPDPDAMGCGAAVARLAEHAGTPATVRYPGRISHQENRAFRTVLGFDLERIEDPAGLDEGAVVLVDHNEPRGFDGAADVEPVAVVDHHPGDGTGSAFTDVREEYGACASVVTEYLRELDATLGAEAGRGPTVPAPLATGLLYGVFSDTSHLTDGCTAADVEAVRYLFGGADEELLDRVANPRVDAETLDVKARAISERDVRPPYAVSDVGTVGNADAIPQAADELAGLETVSAVVVLGDDGDDVLLSGRSRDDRVHMGATIEAALAPLPNADGGGHARMGGGRVTADLGASGRVKLRERLFEEMQA